MKFRVALLMAITFLLVSCVEQVDINEYIDGRQSNSMVVEGMITNEYKRHEVKLTRTGIVASEEYEAITGAEVTISDGIETFLLKEDQEGIYLTDSIAGVEGRLYTLIVKYNSEIYTAEDTMVPVSSFGRADGFSMATNEPPSGYIQSPLIIFGSNAPVMLNIRIDNPKPDDKYTHFTYYAFPGIHPDYILPKYVDAFLSYTDGTSVTQTKYSLSEGHYNFLRALLLETEYNGGIFGSVRADVPTNINNGGRGFFAASATIRRTGVVGPDGRLH
jgi:hypothetical protein